MLQEQERLNYDKIYKHHKPKRDQTKKYEEIRKKAKEFALLIDNHCPNSRERSVALEHLETSVMWANASIARNE